LRRGKARFFLKEKTQISIARLGEARLGVARLGPARLGSARQGKVLFLKEKTHA